MKAWFQIKKVANAARAEVRIFGELGWEVLASEFVRALDDLGKGIDLDVRINSTGGSVMEGIHIYNRLLLHDGSVHVTVEGIAASMASVIAMAGERISMMEAGWLMIHNPAGGAFGDGEDHRKTADILDKIKSTLVSAYVRKTGIASDKIATMMDAETWFTPAEALEAGFIDDIVEVPEDMDIAASLSSVDWSQTKFERIPGQITGRVDVGSATSATVTLPAGVRSFAFQVLPEGDATSAANPAIPAATPATTGVSNDMTEEEKAALQAASEKKGRDQEVARRTAITAVFEGFPGHDETLTACLIDAECSVDDANANLLKAIEAANRVIDPHQAAVVIEDKRDKFRNAASSALLTRSGVIHDNPTNEYRGYSLRELARECAMLAGVDVTGMRPFDYIGAAFSHSSSDFPGLLENVLGKVLLGAYTEWPSTYQEWCRKGQVSDFKVNSRMKLGSFNNLALVGESGEFKEFSVGEEKETIQAVTKGNIFAITRQAIINDDLGAFVAIAQAMGQAARRTVNADAYGVINANGDMADGTAMFHADHNNLAGSGAVISVASVSEAKAAMRTQQFATSGAGSDAKLDIRATHMVVPVALEDVAKTLIASETDPVQANSKKPNIHRNTLEVVSDPVLDDTSAAVWYLVSKPESPVEVDFLDGVEEPFLDSEQGFTVDGVRWKVRLDYAFDSVDFRGGWKNPGP